MHLLAPGEHPTSACVQALQCPTLTLCALLQEEKRARDHPERKPREPETIRGFAFTDQSIPTPLFLSAFLSLPPLYSCFLFLLSY